ncbi:MAG: LytR C-terminal domain-containing protein [Acidimicrobiales bacterium]
MRRGKHAAADGSFGRSAGGAVGRGVVLLAVALGIGLLLLNAVEAEPPGSNVAAGPKQTTTTVAPDPKATTTTLPPVKQPAEVKVLVANGSTVNGAASKTNDKLKSPGYNVLAGVNATVKVQAAVVYFAAGFDREAAVLATVLGLDPAAVVKPMPAQPPVADLQSANVLVVVDDALAKTVSG